MNPNDNPTKFALVDLSGVFRQYWHASENDDVGTALARTVAAVHLVAQDHDRVAICCDPKGKTWRHELHADYKAQREKPNPLLYEQMRQTAKRLKADGFRLFGAPGFEADDCIATLASWLLDAVPECEISVVSEDKDLMQLVDPQVTQRRPIQRDVFGPDDVVAKFGVSPTKLGDLLALMGDKSDNLRGIEKVGIKTGAALLAAHGDLEGVFAAAHDHPLDLQKMQVTHLLAGEERVRMERKLIGLSYDVPLECAKVLQVLAPTPLPARDYTSAPAAKSQPAAPPAEDTQPSSRQAPSSRERVAAAPSSPRRPEPEVIDGVIEAEPARSVALVKATPKDWTMDLQPVDHNHAWNVSLIACNSRQFKFKCPEEAYMILMAGRELGLGVMQSFRSLHAFDGHVTMTAQYMMARCLAKPSICKVFRVLMGQATNESVTVRFQRTDWDEPDTLTWTIDDAKRAGLTGKANWQKYPRGMLINRCISEVARFAFADVCNNMYTAEEMGEAA